MPNDQKVDQQVQSVKFNVPVTIPAGFRQILTADVSCQIKLTDQGVVFKFGKQNPIFVPMSNIIEVKMK